MRVIGWDVYCIAAYGNNFTLMNYDSANWQIAGIKCKLSLSERGKHVLTAGSVMCSFHAA
jgi:hypothetical protein